MRGFGAVILIALGKFLHRNCRAVVKEEANYAAQFGAPFYIEKWKKSQLQIAISCGTVLSANAYSIGAENSSKVPTFAGRIHCGSLLFHINLAQGKCFNWFLMRITAPIPRI